MIETLGGLQLIRAFGRENQEQHRFALASSAVSKAFFKLDRISVLVNPLSEVLTVSLLVGILLATATLNPGANGGLDDFPCPALSAPAPC